LQFILTKRIAGIALLIIASIAGCLVFYAFARTWNKTDIEFRIHINEKLVRESTFGESPTFAIWLEEPGTGLTQTIFVTNRAGLGDWEGKTSVPVALPRWFEVNKAERQSKDHLKNKIPERLTITGATPKPGYFGTRVRVSPGSKWICWIEVNLAGDFNDYYKEYDAVTKSSDEYKTGQPALLYKAEIEAINGNKLTPVIAGMCLLDSLGKAVIKPPEGITTAKGIFDEINIIVIKPRLRIIEWQ
jgi:hypothetical protein